jgi:hypothetical protein
MEIAIKIQRRPRFRRATEPPAFRLTDDDIVIIRQLASHRFLRSTHIAALVGRSLDRTNDRLSKLFHGGYIDRPRAQLEYKPTRGSGPMVYALADLGARLLRDHDGVGIAAAEWSRKNREAGRPFIEHQLEIMDFFVSLQITLKDHEDLKIMHPAELVQSFPDQRVSPASPFLLRARVTHQGVWHDIGVVTDLVFGLKFKDGSRRCFMVEIDRGTMPVTRSSMMQTSFEKKMRAYLSAHAVHQHERQFGWKTFRVLTVTTDDARKRTMIESLRRIRIPHSPGASLFFFATREQLGQADALLHDWEDGNGCNISLVR